MAGHQAQVGELAYLDGFRAATRFQANILIAEFPQQARTGGSTAQSDKLR